MKKCEQSYFDSGNKKVINELALLNQGGKVNEMAIKNDYTVRANIHTIEIATEETINVTQILADYGKQCPEQSEAIDRCINLKVARGKQTVKKCGKSFILNLNKWDGENICLYSEFNEKLQMIMNILGIAGKYKIVRADLKFDSTDPEFYERNKKLVRLILTVIANEEKVKNFWRAEDGATLEQRSLRVNASSWDLEYYNKTIESNGEDVAAARLEYRYSNTKDGIKILADTFEIRMTDLFMSMIDEDNEISVQGTLEKCNQQLLKYWESGKYKNLHYFVSQERYQEIMFTRGQLAALIARIEQREGKETNTRKWIDNHNRRYSKLDFVRAEDIADFWECLRNARIKYFSN